MNDWTASKLSLLRAQGWGEEITHIRHLREIDAERRARTVLTFKPKPQDHEQPDTGTAAQERASANTGGSIP